MFNKIKSPGTLFNSSIETLVNLLLKEQRAQRGDLSTIKRQLNRLINDSKLQKDVDDYYEDKPPEEVTQDSNPENSQ